MKPRHLIGVATATLALVGSGLVTSTASAAPNDAQAAAASWLADQLTDGLVHGQYGPDYGLSLDLVFALRELDTEPGAVSQIMSAIGQDPTAYTTGEAFGDTDSQYAGATAKLATAVQVVGQDPASFGGHDLIAELEGVVVDDGDEAGRAVDRSGWGDYSNTIGQSLAVRALAGAESDELDAALGYLLKQQCANGAFRINMFKDGSTPRECGAVDSADTVTVDATAYAVAALQDAADAGASGTSGPLGQAKAYLESVQASDGSFIGDAGPNSNSTGLGGAALAGLGADDAAADAAAWIADLQVTDAVAAANGKLADEVGAIALDEESLSDGKSDGIDTTRDQWIRATSQAILGLGSLEDSTPDPVGPVDELVLSVSDSNPRQGDTITVTAEGRDADGRSTGDVSDELELSSSVESDTIDGNKVTFNHASPHTIIAVHVPTGTTATITVQVTPASDSSAGPGSSTDGGSDALPDAGSSIEPWHAGLAALLVLFGVALVVVARERRLGAHRADAR